MPRAARNPSGHGREAEIERPEPPHALERKRVVGNDGQLRRDENRRQHDPVLLGETGRRRTAAESRARSTAGAVPPSGRAGRAPSSRGGRRRRTAPTGRRRWRPLRRAPGARRTARPRPTRPRAGSRRRATRNTSHADNAYSAMFTAWKTIGLPMPERALEREGENRERAIAVAAPDLRPVRQVGTRATSRARYLHQRILLDDVHVVVGESVDECRSPTTRWRAARPTAPRRGGARPLMREG